MARTPNRLAAEASPYLRQHMHNPVDWYPWGPEAFARARREDKPILLSVGYAACHWCHVMEADAFDVDAVADLLNRHFVSVKVDREERPDVDQVYQGVVQLLGRGGGWPLTVFLDPEGRPFFGGTYFPPQDRYGLPGFSRLLATVADAWQHRRPEIERSARSFAEGLSRLAAVGVDGAPGEPTRRHLVDAAGRLLDEVDPDHGGFGGAPKFPASMALSFLLRIATAREGDGIEGDVRTEARNAVLLSLSSMARGGIHDVLGGGFHRYSVDERWAVPHFEKMLYDNALLVRLYAEAAVAFREEEYAEVARGIAAWLAREMTAPGGGFYSSQDADSEGEEGKFFVFTRDEVDRILGADLGELAARHFGVTEEGNFEDGRTVLSIAVGAEGLAASGGGEASVAARLEEARRRLFVARERRVRPATDDKILASWNGLAIGGLAAAGRLLGDEEMIAMARRAAEFVAGNLIRDGRLYRVHREGLTKGEAFLDDHSHLAEGFLELFEATGEGRWLEAAADLAREIVDRFWDGEVGAFHLAARDGAAASGDVAASGGAAAASGPTDGPALPARPRSLEDNALPAGASSAVHAFLKLLALRGDERFGQVAAHYLRARRDGMVDSPFAFGHLLCAAFLLVEGPVEVAVLGPPGPERDALLAAARRTFRPEVLAFAADRPVGPALAGRGPVAGRPAAFVCRAFACEAPRTDPEELARALEEG
jgi:uncharacterized protein YyaL (SSP411 family)